MSFRLPFYYLDTCRAFGGRPLSDTPSKITIYSIGINISVSEKAKKQIREPQQGWTYWKLVLPAGPNSNWGEEGVKFAKG